MSAREIPQIVSEIPLIVSIVSKVTSSVKRDLILPKEIPLIVPKEIPLTRQQSQKRPPNSLRFVANGCQRSLENEGFKV